MNSCVQQITVIEKQTVSAEFLGGSALPIVDHTVLAIPLNVTSTAAISSLSVGLRFNHTYDADLLIELVSPSGQTIQLANHVGGSGNNFGSGAESCKHCQLDRAEAIGLCLYPCKI